MSPQLLASKIVVQEEEPRIRNIPPQPTAVTAMVGIAERGPVGTATLTTSFEEYNRIFGSYTANTDMTLAAQGFFDNGGSFLWIVRTVHYTDITSAATKTSAAATITLVDRAGTPLSTLKVDGKTDGAYANDIKIIIANATNGETDEFNLSVEDGGVIVEVFPNLSMTDADPNFVETVINDADTGSNLIKVTDLDSATSSPNDLPAIGTSAAMTGGDDGLTSLADTDFIGSETSKTGIRALDLVQDARLLLIPGRATSAVQNAMITYCETTRNLSMFAVLDPPANQSASQIITYVETTAQLLGLTEFASIYWPRIKIVNPSKTVYGIEDSITVAPSGHIAGLYARVDASRPGGVYVPPAGTENGRIFGMVGIETDEVLDETKRDLVYPKRINPISSLPGVPWHIDGTRTLKGDGNFPTVAERRGAIFIEQSIKAGLIFAKHRNNTSSLRAEVDRTVFAFMLTQLRNGAFRSDDPAEAFFVDFSDALNPPNVVFEGKLIGRVGLATNKPTDWIILRFSQDTRAIEEALAAP